MKIVDADKRSAKYWKLKAKKKKFQTAKDILAAAQEYIDLTYEYPVYTYKPHMYEGEIIYSKTPIMRAMTLQDLCRFMGITFQHWIKLGESEDQEIADAVKHVEAIIYAQKYTGAAAGIFNSALISRELGLAEHVNYTREGEDKIEIKFIAAKDGRPANPEDMEDDDPQPEIPDDI